MKNVLIILTAFSILGLTLSGCKKEKTYDERLSGNWQSINVKTNGTDVTSFFSLDLNLKSSNTFNGTLTLINPITGTTDTSNSTGIWESNETLAQLTLTYDSSGDVETYDVLELTDTSLKVEIFTGGDHIEIAFEKQ